MQPTIFKFVWRYSKRPQILLLILTALSFPFLWVSLELPKTIINEAIGGSDFPREIMGREVDQIDYLLILSVAFLIVVLFNGGFKYAVNVYRGVIGERMLRRLRYQLLGYVTRFPLPHFRRVSQGEVVSMVSAETEPLGGFIGDCLAVPAYQGGTLLVILAFMFVQDWVMGLAAIALYPVQGWLIPKLQRKLNQLKKERVVLVRKLSERIGEVVSGMQEIHAHDTSQLELADFSERLGDIYTVRYKIYKQKFLIKFLNNFIAQITPFFFYSIGGYLVIKGELTLGALVAALTAYKDLSAPWKELLNYYQIMEDARIKYDLLVETFQPDGLLTERVQSAEPNSAPLTGQIIATNLNLHEDADASFVAGATFKVDVDRKLSIVGPGGSGTHRLATVLAGLNKPLGGSLTVGGLDVPTLPETFTGRRFAYVGQEPRLRAGTLRDALFYSLKHRPVASADDGTGDPQANLRKREAELSGNSPFDIRADWIDYTGAQVAGPDELVGRAMDVLQIVDLHQDVYQLGLSGTVAPEQRPDLAERIMQARAELRDRLQDPAIAPLVELFDAERYNTNLSVGENLLFGTPLDATLDVQALHTNAYMRKVLQETGLTDQFLTIGRTVAELMVELFADVAPDSELFEQFSFISADDLPEFRAMLSRTEEGKTQGVSPDDRTMMLSLPFKLVVARHRLSLIDESLQARILEARRVFATGFGSGPPEVDFYDRDRYSATGSIQDNILFGRLAYGRARSAQQIGALIREVVDKLALRDEIMEVGLDYHIGIGGSRLSSAQRLKLAIARCVIKRPDLLIVDEATAALDGATQLRIMNNLLAEMGERGLIWVLHRASLAEHFDLTMVLDEGRVVQLGPYGELVTSGTLLKQLVAEA
ncbi:MAG: ATP-binding cassette domain-containing protein [Gammaproteobacteria bacterium]|nr:ATP-binding cassette domain-containing protein [Gammaproteobacteria bacterium]